MQYNVKKAVTSALPSYSDFVNGNKKTGHSTELQFVITGLIETESTYFKQVEKNLTDLSDLVQHMGLQAGGNILSIQQLGKIGKQHNNSITYKQRRCRPILVRTSNSYFMENCFARSHYLLNYKHPVYIKKLLSSADRQLEKAVLAKRYHMVRVEGKDKQDFQIKNLKLYCKNTLVDIATN